MSAASSIYRLPSHAKNVAVAYDAIFARWPVPATTHTVRTRWGSVNVIESGPKDGQPVLALHAASMAAISWLPNIGVLHDEGFRVFMPDYIGEAGRSQLDEIDVFPRTPAEIGALQVEISDGLGLDRAHLLGASNGGHAALRMALAEPERVQSIALLGPMGVQPLSFTAIARMMMVNIFPSPRRVDRTVRWSIGSAPAVLDAYGHWFATVLRGIASPPRVGAPVYLRPDEWARIGVPVLLVLGNNDPLVGPPSKALRRVSAAPSLTARTLSSGHLVGVERADEVNRLLVEFLR
jgi:pimeloyl-ACP methyl ester carboxylesterase